MEQQPDERQLDERLRRALEPDPLSVERVLRKALRDGGRHEARLAVGAWPRLAAAAALLLLAVLAIPFFFHTPPPEEPAQIAPEPATPVRIKISNEDGYVKISSTAGPTWIVLPGDES